MILDEKHCFQFPDDGKSYNGITHNVYFGGSGPGVLLMHELPGMTPLFLSLADRIANAGFKVYAPLFFGQPNERLLWGGVPAVPLICIRHEFELFRGHRSSRITPWLRALAQHIDADTGGGGIGVIGLCLTGNIVLSLMTEPSVRVPVMCEPGLPFMHPHSLGVSDDDVCAAVNHVSETPLMAYRFTGDKICPPERFVALRTAFEKAPERLHACEIRSGVPPWNIPKRAHSVLTEEYPGMEDPNHPVHHVLDEILMKFKVVLGTPRPARRDAASVPCTPSK